MPNSAPARDGISMSLIEATQNLARAVTIRPCESHEDRKLCVDLQRRIWNFTDEELVPAAIFQVAQHTGGHAYCAFDGDRAVGFALAFLAEHDGHRIWHSHMVGVLPEYQNRGTGRLLKLHQRDEALRRGIGAIEWTFDPLALRNAYFNIARLGAIIRRYIPDCYGTSSSPLHGSLPTDRFVAEWHLDSNRVRKALAGDRMVTAGGAQIELPVSTLGPTRERQQELRRQCMDLFRRGYAITSFRRDVDRCTYGLEHYEN